MRAKLIVNDVHLGAARASGTTDTSAKALRAYLQTEFRAFIMQHLDKDLILNGDVFDTFSVPMADVLEFYQIIGEWLDKADGLGRVILGMGNHDFAKDSSKMSSLEFVGRVLESQYGGHVKLVMEPELVCPDIYMIPHVANQDIFDLELKRAEAVDAKFVLIHANYDNHFAIEADHSLNVTEAQAKALHRAGKVLIFGHEHQARQAGGVICTGNQWPSSIADCLGNPGNHKIALEVSKNPEWCFTQHPTWWAKDTFIEVDWKQIADTPNTVQFVRVVGEATAEQAADVIGIISKYRQKSGAFVVKNSVSIAGVQDMDDLPEALEITKQFDVLAYLFEQLTEEQGTTVKKLLAERELVEVPA